MTIDLEKAARFADLLIKLEVHAILMLAVGSALCLHGQKDEGTLIIGGALAVFKGKPGS
jgi:hypothetical protein